MRQLVYLFLFFLIALPAFSQPNPSTVQPDYEALLTAERSFAQMAMDKGIKEAFVANLDDQSVVFLSDHFTPGKTTYQQIPTTIPGKLTWQPVFAEISACGTLGFTTGPFEFRPRTMADKPVAYGQFTSVWHKTATGDWKVLIDLGCKHAKPAEQVATPQIPDQFIHKTTVQLDTSILSRELMQTELSFAQTAGDKSLREAYMPVIPTNNSIRLLREGHLVYEGNSARELANRSTEQVNYQPLRAVVSAAGDLGYCYGYATCQQSRSAYLRIWRKRNDQWQLVHEVLTVKLI